MTHSARALGHSVTMRPSRLELCKDNLAVSLKEGIAVIDRTNSPLPTPGACGFGEDARYLLSFL